MDIQLLPTYSPLTVANFLKYVGLDDGTPKYVGTIIHRSSPSLGIVQGGGYRLNAAGTAYEHIGNYGTVVNEYDGTGDTPTNIRGTVAMAKRDNDPDSATSEWFVNLVDNSSTLGLSANGGYTVFGYITNQEGLDFFDYVNGLTTTDTQPTVAGYSPTVVYAERISELTFEVVENTAPELVTATISENLWLQLDANTDGAAGTARITLKATAPDGREVTQRLTVLVNGAVESETRFEVALSLPEAARPPAKSRLEQVFDALRGIKEDTAAATDVRSSYYDTDPESATYGTSIATAASVTADLTGVPADATYVWQKHSAGALYWSDIDGTAGTVGTATGADAAATFTVAAGEEYRLLVSDAAGDALGVAPVPSLNVLTGASLALTGVAWSSNGTAYVLLNGGKATFGVTGTGSGRIYYQWYFLPLDYTDDTYDWEPVTTGLGATITVTRAGYYFCYAVDRSGLLSQSDFVTVTTN
ncbi:MAG: peptidylprolyl isomerase [Puniceicoccales bacterium]|nr:peptidylprolyl isomerase [Puniceicoccales bacterium]